MVILAYRPGSYAKVHQWFMLHVCTVGKGFALKEALPSFAQIVIVVKNGIDSAL